MHETLILKAFKKVKDNTGYDKPYTIANFLSDYILEETKKPYGEAILVKKFKAAQQENKKVVLKPFVLDALCKYLEYQNFDSFIKEHPLTQEKSSSFTLLFKSPWVKVSIVISMLLITAIVSYNFANRERWMVWSEDRYVEVPFNVNLVPTGDLKKYKQERIDKFRRISADCNTDFFYPDGMPAIWYGKNKDKQLEYFTDFGLHPETGQTLKKITPYMIKTHICNSY